MSGRRSSEAALAALPWRGPGGDRPELPLPPAPMPLRFAGTLRKRWRYLSAFGEELMICSASVKVGPISQTFWAVLDRSSGELHERTLIRLPIARGEVWSEDGEGRPRELGSETPTTVTRIDSGGLTAKLRVSEGPWIEAICANPGAEGAYVWTRKRVAPVACAVRLPDGRRIRAEMRGIEDESAGYHPRHTVWSWSAGIGVSADGRAVGWNLVEGINDPPERSERAIWLEGEDGPREPAPVRFDGLEAVSFADGSRLDFSAEAERARSERKPFVSYSYRQPFGTFSGSLDGIELASGIGVMEHQDAVW